MVNDDKLLEIKQNWWHVEEIYFPTNARIIRQVMDLFTNQSQIPIVLNDNFVGLKVTARNSSNSEIAFLEYSDGIILNLTNLNSFPSIPSEFLNIFCGYNYRHVRIEIEYILIDPKIGVLEREETLLKLKDKIWNKIFPKRISTIAFAGITQAEIYITLPLGWRMSGGNIFQKFFRSHKSTEGYTVGMECILYLFSWDEIPGNDEDRIIEFLKDELKIEWAKTENISKIDDDKTIIVSNKEKSLSLKLNDEKTKVNLKIDDNRIYEYSVKTENGKLNIYNCFNVKFCKPFIKLNNDKRTYNYLIHSIDYLKLKKNEGYDLRFEFIYQSQISYTIAIISIIPFIIFLPYSLYISTYYVLYLFKIPTSLIIINSSIAIGISILLLTFSVFYYNLIREGYDIPHKYWHLIILFFSIIMFFVVIYMDINFQDLQNTNSMVTNFYKQFFIFIK